MTNEELIAQRNDEYEKRLLDIAWSAVCKVTEVYKRTPRRLPDELDKLKMLENVEQELGLLRQGGPFL